MKSLAAIIILLIFSINSFAMTVKTDRNRVLIDGNPYAFFASRGMIDATEMQSYRAIGLNTVILPVSTTAAETENKEGFTLNGLKLMISAAEKNGLYIIIEFTPGDWTPDYYINLKNPVYNAAAENFIKTIITETGNTEHLIGWLISTTNEDKSIPSVSTFSAYTFTKYRTLDNLNKAWSTPDRNVNENEKRQNQSRIQSFATLTEQTAPRLAMQSAVVQKLVYADIQEFRKLKNDCNLQFQQFLKSRYATLDQLNKMWLTKWKIWEEITVDRISSRAKPLKIAPMAMIELAKFSADEQRSNMAWWTQKIADEEKKLKRNDGRRLIFAGSQEKYRTLIGLPGNIDAVMADCHPGNAEADLDLQNPHAVDIARRGEKFAVFTEITLNGIDSYQMANATYAAFFHGAAGVVVNDWQSLANSHSNVEIFTACINDIINRRIACRTPMPTTAIIYSPYTPGTPAMKEPLYGYLPGQVNYGASMLFYTWRDGTAFGQFDYLSVYDIPARKIGDIANPTGDDPAANLKKYSVIIMPNAIDLPEPAAVALRAWVKGGGILLADANAGIYQANGNEDSMPGYLENLFGIKMEKGMEYKPLNLEVIFKSPYFKLLTPGLRTTGLAKGFVMSDNVKATLQPGADLLCDVVDTNVIPATPAYRKYVPLTGKVIRGMTIMPQGEGAAIFALFNLYSRWAPGNMMFDELHRDLLSRGAKIALEKPIDLIPTNASVAYYADKSVALWLRDDNAGSVVVNNADGQVYAGRDLKCTIDENIVRISAIAGLVIADPLPIYFRRNRFPTDIEMKKYDETEISFAVIAQEGNQIRPISWVISSGKYKILPSSKHHVQITTRSGIKYDKVIAADEQGRLDLISPEACCQVSVTVVKE
ncbi:MAG: beta-galactosidase trimerization domain-containing protein [bacterium]